MMAIFSLLSACRQQAQPDTEAASIIAKAGLVKSKQQALQAEADHPESSMSENRPTLLHPHLRAWKSNSSKWCSNLTPACFPLSLIESEKMQDAPLLLILQLYLLLPFLLLLLLLLLLILLILLLLLPPLQLLLISSLPFFAFAFSFFLSFSRYPPFAEHSKKDKDVVLVTGGLGFIGSHVVEEMLSRGKR